MMNNKVTKSYLQKKANNISSSTRRASEKVSQRVSTSNPTLKFGKEFIKWFTIIFFAFLILFPFYYMISMSLMTNAEITHTDPSIVGDNPVFLPNVPIWENYKMAWQSGYFQSFLFSTAVVVVNVVFKLFVCSLLGYAFGNFNFKYKKGLWGLFMLTLMIPEVALLSGQWKLVLQYHLKDGLMILLTLSGPFIASVFTAYMYRNAFEAIPSSVKEAALIDGISGPRYFFSISLPMVKGTTWTVIILTTFASWNSYMWPSLILATSDYDTIPLWLMDVGESIDGTSRVYDEIKMAGSVLAIIPTLVFYILFKNKINNAVTGDSANKG